MAILNVLKWRQLLMSLLIFRFWIATVLILLKNGLKLLKNKALEIIPKYGRTEAKVGLRVVERTIIFETHFS